MHSYIIKCGGHEAWTRRTCRWQAEDDPGANDYALEGTKGVPRNGGRK